MGDFFGWRRVGGVVGGSDAVGLVGGGGGEDMRLDFLEEFLGCGGGEIKGYL